MDLTQLILDAHPEPRRLGAILEQLARAAVASLTTVWGRLAAFLDVHAEAEERFFYPDLLKLGQGAGSKPTAADETEDAIDDHNDIRDSVAAVADHPVGAPDWWKAVAKANEANSKHMGEEEREGLTDFRLHADLARRHALAVRFAVFEAAHITGVTPVDKDAKAYIAANGRAWGRSQLASLVNARRIGSDPSRMGDRT